jgi:PilZ domain-containing protein
MHYPKWLKKFKNRRRSSRMRTDNLLAVYWEGLPDCSHPVREISLEGARIETAVSWTKGTLIRLNLASVQSGQPARPSESILNLWSRVVREIPEGFCVEFVFESRDERRQFMRFVRGLYGMRNGGHEHEKIEEKRLQGSGND